MNKPKGNAGDDIQLVRPDQAGRGLGPDRRLAARVAPAVWAAGIIWLVVSLLDYGVLWILQRQPGPNWEFVAVSRTLESLADMAIVVFLLLLAGWLSQVRGEWFYKLVGAFSIFLGLASLGLGALLFADYLVLRVDVTPETGIVFNSSVVKGWSYGLVYAAGFIVAGIFAMRTPKGVA